MLLRFIVENYGSFRDRSEFSMVAGKTARHPGHVCEEGGVGILRSTFLFGANAGGKTSFFSAVKFAVSIVCHGAFSVDCDSKSAFRLCKKPKEDGLFQFDFVEDECVYSYGFVLSYVTHEVKAEWLYLCDGKQGDTCVFSRETDKKGKTILESDFGDKIKAANWFANYCQDFAGGDNAQELALSDLARRSSEENELVRHAIAARRWFSRIVTLRPGQNYREGFFLESDTLTQEAFTEYLRLFDTGITNVVLKKLTDKETVDVLAAMTQAARDRLSSMLRTAKRFGGHFIEGSTIVSNGEANYFFTFKKGAWTAQQLAYEHGQKGVLLDRADESDGTRRLFDLIPLLFRLQAGAIVFVDEIDRSLHTKALVEFVRGFLRQSGEKGGQLIATTHDGELLDLDLLRQDEIWFVERDDDHVSRLFPLSKFRNISEDIRKDYLLGRYGALPIFGRLGEVEA